MRLNFFLKGSRVNPYKEYEFPEFHIENATAEELERLRDAWYSNPNIWKDREQPDWDLLFELAGV